MRVILASESPNKREVLEHAGIAFETMPSGYEEDMTLDRNPQELATELALGKARAITAKHPEAIVIATDVFVEFEGQLIGKAKDPHEARRTLSRYPGKNATVICGVSVIRGEEERIWAETAKIAFRDDLSEDEIAGYIATGEPMEASCPFKMSRMGVHLITEAGNYTTIIGLPIVPVLRTLREFGDNPLLER